jgi:hypothetical protein
MDSLVEGVNVEKKAGLKMLLKTMMEDRGNG